MILAVVDNDLLQRRIFFEHIGLQDLHAAADFKVLHPCILKRTGADFSHTVGDHNRTAELIGIAEGIRPNGDQGFREGNRFQLGAQKAPPSNGGQLVAQSDGFNIGVAECLVRDLCQAGKIHRTRQLFAFVKCTSTHLGHTAQVHRTGQSRAFFKCIGFDPFHCTKVRDFLQSAALIKRRQPDRSDLPPGCNTLQFAASGKGVGRNLRDGSGQLHMGQRCAVGQQAPFGNHKPFRQMDAFQRRSTGKSRRRSDPLQ